MRNAFVFYHSLSPVRSISEILNSLLDKNIDVLILEAYCSGTIGHIYHPVIKKATQMKIPVFSIRRSTTDEWFTEWSDRKEEILPGLYEDEAEAIGIGLIPLQKDLVRRDEVIKGIKEIADQNSDYHKIIASAMRKYSSDKFNERLNQIRVQYHLEPIEY
jgi:hypothetical protein